METSFQTVPGAVVAPRGFLAAGVVCGIQQLGTGKGSLKGRKPDLALIVSEVPATVAGMFTTNQVCAAPVQVCLEHVRAGVAQAIVANSGNANACTGARGLRDARQMAAQVARALHMPERHVLVASTGRIGVPLPIAAVRRGIRDALEALDHSPRAAELAARAIMTSDTHPKQLAVEFKLGRRTVRLGGIAKGAGMIHPGMSLSGRRPAARRAPHATMLCFLTTDAAVRPAALRRGLHGAVAASFNRITVDGDMSTNDTVLLLANGLAENPTLTGTEAAWRAFQEALDHVCLELAKMIVRDGEGVHRIVTVRVSGARTPQEADAAARAVANSALVKTSWHGGDPNWGRVMDALGYSTARVEPERVDIGYSAPGSRQILWSVRGGRAAPVAFARLCQAVSPREFDLHIRLNLGRGAAVIYAADLTEQYVELNKGDLSDPAALGG